MSVKTKAQLKAEKNANINTNGTNAITGAILNTYEENLIDSCLNRTDDAGLLGVANYSASLSYVAGQGVNYNDSYYICTTTTTGTFNSAHWLKVGGKAHYSSFVNGDLTTSRYLDYNDTGIGDTMPTCTIRDNGNVISEYPVERIDADNVRVDLGGAITGTWYYVFKENI